MIKHPRISWIKSASSVKSVDNFCLIQDAGFARLVDLSPEFETRHAFDAQPYHQNTDQGLPDDWL
jgi:hypothetical protein